MVRLQAAAARGFMLVRTAPQPTSARPRRSCATCEEVGEGD